MWFGHTGPIIKAKLFHLVGREQASDPLKAALAENARLRGRIEALTTQPSSIASDLNTDLTSDKPIVNVSPEDLLKFFDDHVSIQAERLMEPYLGQWMKIANVEIRNVIEMAGGRLGVSTQGKAFLFFDAKWKPRLAVLKRRSIITAIGQIKEISMGDVHLENCELLGSHNTELP
jgi:hypothetical protein